jgi:hypothetical protein
MASVDSRAASESQNADASVIGAPAHRSHSARACADAPSENFIMKFRRQRRIRSEEATTAILKVLLDQHEGLSAS